jgi:hypothetical protein
MQKNKIILHSQLSKKPLEFTCSLIRRIYSPQRNMTIVETSTGHAVVVDTFHAILKQLNDKNIDEFLLCHRIVKKRPAYPVLLNYAAIEDVCLDVKKRTILKTAAGSLCVLEPVDDILNSLEKFKKAG